VQQERPIKPHEIVERYELVAVRTQEEQAKIMDQEASLAKELREIGDGTEVILQYAEQLEKCLETNVLSLRSLKLLAVPTEIFTMSHVEVLDLASNAIEVLPTEVANMSRLKKLYLDNNKLTRLPHELYKLSQTLALLGIANNPLDDELMQLYYAGLPVLLAHLKATRPRRATSSLGTSRSISTDLATFDLFTSALPDYPTAAPLDATTKRLTASIR
jgi:Leucine-rich repeat (LRR) protein